jgi:hypothetical protein
MTLSPRKNRRGSSCPLVEQRDEWGSRFRGHPIEIKNWKVSAGSPTITKKSCHWLMSIARYDTRKKIDRETSVLNQGHDRNAFFAPHLPSVLTHAQNF